MRTILTSIDPCMEDRGAKVRLNRLIEQKNIERIIVLNFKKRGAATLETGVHVVYLHVKILDIFLILYNFCIRRKPLTNAIFFRGRVVSELANAEYILIHLVRCIVIDLSRFNNVEIDVCEALSVNYKIRCDLLSLFSLKKYIFRIDSHRLRRLELDVSHFKTYFINASDPLIPHMCDYEILSNIDKPVFKECNINVPFKILFIGHMDYEPNFYGVLSLCENLKGSKYCIDICGTISEARRKQLLKFEFVRVLGFVEDLSSLGDDYTCGVALLAGSTGTQNKVFDYLRLGMPAVVDSHLKGLDSVEDLIYRVDIESSLIDVLDEMADVVWRKSYNNRIRRLKG